MQMTQESQFKHICRKVIYIYYLRLCSTRLNNLMEKQQRNRKSQRCVLHTLEIQRLPPIWNYWREVWDCMELPCRQELTLIETDTLDEALDTYLRKHRYVISHKLSVIVL